MRCLVVSGAYYGHRTIAFQMWKPAKIAYWVWWLYPLHPQPAPMCLVTWARQFSFFQSGFITKDQNVLDVTVYKKQNVPFNVRTVDTSIVSDLTWTLRCLYFFAAAWWLLDIFQHRLRILSYSLSCLRISRSNRTGVKYGCMVCHSFLLSFCEEWTRGCHLPGNLKGSTIECPHQEDLMWIPDLNWCWSILICPRRQTWSEGYP